MIAKLSKGGSFGGAIDYVLDKKKDAELLAGMGVRMKDNESITRSFEMQAVLNPRLSKPVGHIVLAFSAQDVVRLDNRQMVEIAVEYLVRMGIKNTQFIIARHYNREHPHLHILSNRVDNVGRTISDRNDRYRSERLCKELTAQHSLYFASGKENVKKSRLRESDKTKHEIYHALRDAVPRCRDWPELTAALRRDGIATEFKMRSGTNEPQGVVFAKNGYPFNGSKIDRQFSYSKNLLCFDPEPTIHTFRRRTPLRRQSDTLVQPPAGRPAPPNVQSRRGATPPAATAQKETTTPPLTHRIYGNEHDYRTFRRTQKANRRTRAETRRA